MLLFLKYLTSYVFYPRRYDGEIQMLETLNALAAKIGVEMGELMGKRFDCGYVEV